MVDHTGTLSAEQRDALEAKLVPSSSRTARRWRCCWCRRSATRPSRISPARVTDEWKLGRKDVDDGVLFVIAKQDQQMRIQSGRGVQGIAHGRAFQAHRRRDRGAALHEPGDFAGGIDAGTDAIMKAVEGEALPLPQAAQAGPPAWPIASFADFFWLAFFVVPIAGADPAGRARAASSGAAVTSGVTGLAAWFVIGSLAIVIVAAMLAFVFTLVVGHWLPRAASAPEAGAAGDSAAVDSAAAGAADSAAAAAASTAAAPRGPGDASRRASSVTR